MRTLAFLALLYFALATGCVTVSTLDHGRTPTPQPPDRDACGEILDTAFRSGTEQAWFAENCSDWARATLGRVNQQGSGQPASEPTPDEPPQQARGPATPGQATEVDPGRCAAMRGRQYESPEDRAWFLKNCIQAVTLPGEPAECAQVRGRPYESPAQRAWFLTTCTASPAARPDPGGPDRQSCSEIFGTPYRSGAERLWFLQKCI